MDIKSILPGFFGYLTLVHRKIIAKESFLHPSTAKIMMTHKTEHSTISQMKLLVALFFLIPGICDVKDVCAQSGIHFELGFQSTPLKVQTLHEKWNDILVVGSCLDVVYNIEGGVGYQYELNSKMIVRATALYSNIQHVYNVAKLNSKNKNFPPEWETPIIPTQRRIAIPIVMQYRLFKNLMIGGGIESGIKLKIVSDVQNSETVKTQYPELIPVEKAIISSFRPVTWSPTVMLSYQIIKKRVSINCQYSSNISQVKSINFQGKKQVVSSTYWCFAVRIGYLLFSN